MLRDGGVSVREVMAEGSAPKALHQGFLGLRGRERRACQGSTSRTVRWL